MFRMLHQILMEDLNSIDKNLYLCIQKLKEDLNAWKTRLEFNSNRPTGRTLTCYWRHCRLKRFEILSLIRNTCYQIIRHPSNKIYIKFGNNLKWWLKYFQAIKQFVTSQELNCLHFTWCVPQTEKQYGTPDTEWRKGKMDRRPTHLNTKKVILEIHKMFS